MKKTKIYLDTTVINFIHADDAPAYRDDTLVFFKKLVEPEIVEVFISDVVMEEILKTQNPVRLNKLLESVNKYKFQVLQLNPEAIRLGDSYIEEKIIPANKLEDARHVGISTVNEMDILLSWNFQHLANYSRKQRIRLVNQKEKYFYPLDIITPLELKYERD
jgi:hypothetical protein